MKFVAYLDKDGNGLSETEPKLAMVPAGKNAEEFAETFFNDNACQKAVLFEQYQYANAALTMSVSWDDVEKGKIKEWP